MENPLKLIRNKLLSFHFTHRVPLASRTAQNQGGQQNEDDQTGVLQMVPRKLQEQLEEILVDELLDEEEQAQNESQSGGDEEREHTEDDHTDGEGLDDHGDVDFDVFGLEPHGNRDVSLGALLQLQVLVEKVLRLGLRMLQVLDGGNDQEPNQEASGDKVE